MHRSKNGAVQPTMQANQVTASQESVRTMMSSVEVPADENNNISLEEGSSLANMLPPDAMRKLP